jgi:hypothetical protein
VEDHGTLVLLEDPDRLRKHDQRYECNAYDHEDGGHDGRSQAGFGAASAGFAIKGLLTLAIETLTNWVTRFAPAKCRSRNCPPPRIEAEQAVL